MANKAEKGTSSQGEGRGSSLEKDKAKGKEPTKESTEGPRHFLTMKELYEMGGRTGNVKYFAAWVTDLPGLKTGAPMKFRYRVALEYFQAKYPDLSIEEDPFTDCRKDANVQMEGNQPFDDSTPLED
ncbi:hypothetical protein GW17_00048415 [Ensete ventricosum]|nr:hypothetical protein GW17_00048415 [Ensete ventricosum]